MNNWKAVAKPSAPLEVIRLASILARVLCVVVVCGVMSAQMLMQPLGVVGIPGGAGCRGYKGMGLKIDSPWYGPWGIVGFLAAKRCNRLPKFGTDCEGYLVRNGHLVSGHLVSKWPSCIENSLFGHLVSKIPFSCIENSPKTEIQPKMGLARKNRTNKGLVGTEPPVVPSRRRSLRRACKLGRFG